MGYLWALMSVLLVSGAQLMMRAAMLHLPPIQEMWVFLSSLLREAPGSLMLIMGLLGYLLSMGCWFMALRELALSKAYALLSLSYAIVWAASFWLLPQDGNRFSLLHIAAVALIIGGVLLISLPRRGEKTA